MSLSDEIEELIMRPIKEHPLFLPAFTGVDMPEEVSTQVVMDLINGMLAAHAEAIGRIAEHIDFIRDEIGRPYEPDA
jgi:hypothetical protein